MKIYRHNDNGFVYYEAIGEKQPFNLLAFTVTDLINQLFSIYSIDLRRYLFCPPILPIVNHSQLN